MMTNLYSAEQSRELDQLAMEAMGADETSLMERAGLACYRALRGSYPEARRLLIVCGAGNNAGDGYVVARLAREDDLEVETLYLSPPENLAGDAAVAWQKFQASGLRAMQFRTPLPETDLAVDAIMGTGLNRPLIGDFGEAVNALNAQDAPIVSIDIPSGINADTGASLGRSVAADLTVTFITQKLGLHTGDGRQQRGRLVFAGLDAFDRQPELTPSARLLRASDLRFMLDRRQVNSHKGSHGFAAIIGGQPGMGGAPTLAGRAAMRSGAGAVRVGTHAKNQLHVALHSELMTVDLDDSAADEVGEWATALAIGPGLGTGSWGEEQFNRFRQLSMPQVLDADGLRLLARQPDMKADQILTPHPGEAAALLDCTVEEIQRDRIRAARQIVERFGGAVILKGAGSVIADQNRVAIIDAGNPGMATAGMGDVLTGVTVAFMAQKMSPFDAAATAALAHAHAGDLAAGSIPRGLIASDVIAHLRRAVNLD